jgi:hypothetical protein
VDPHRLYIGAPEGINLMLVQAVCENNLVPSGVRRHTRFLEVVLPPIGARLAQG